MAKKINYAELFTVRKNDGRYQGSYMDENGKQRFVSNKDPEKLYKKLELLKQPPPPTFNDIAEAWHEKYWDGYKEGTKACYAANYNRIIDKYGSKKASEITAFEINQYLQSLADDKLSQRVIKAVRTLFSLIYRNAITDEKYGKFITNNPSVFVPVPSTAKPPKKREAPEDEIVEKIRANAETAYFGRYAMLLISTGLRRGEALALTWDDIDFTAKTIVCNKQVVFRGTPHIDDTKTEAGVRTIPLLPDLEKVLKKTKKVKGTECVFPNKTGGFLNQASYKRHWMHYCKDMGFVTVAEEQRKSKQGHDYTHCDYKSTLTAHVLRHGYATMLYDAGVDVYTAQKLLGHANIETTMAVYTHLSKRKQQQSINALKSYVSNGYKVAMAEGMANNLQSSENT